jgi:hypothetical protein
MKPIHAKPSLYAFYFYEMKEIALKYGYNLCLHGSLNRDLDVVAIPWSKPLGNHLRMIGEFSELLGGSIMFQSEEQRNCFPHGRQSFVINLNRRVEEDPQYYIDISVIPTP